AALVDDDVAPREADCAPVEGAGLLRVIGSLIRRWRLAAGEDVLVIRVAIAAHGAARASGIHAGAGGLLARANVGHKISLRGGGVGRVAFAVHFEPDAVSRRAVADPLDTVACGAYARRDGFGRTRTAAGEWAVGV